MSKIVRNDNNRINNVNINGDNYYRTSSVERSDFRTRRDRFTTTAAAAVAASATGEGHVKLILIAIDFTNTWANCLFTIQFISIYLFIYLSIF